MAKRVSRRLVALSAAAVAAIYAAGYSRTLPALGRQTEAAAPPPVVPTPATTSPNLEVRPLPPSASPAVAPDRPTLAPPSVPATPAAPAAGATAPSGAYHDGTYRGYGTSRRGDVEVAVTIQGGRIVTCQITRCLTQYPESRIAKLPAQVVAHQTANVDRVSGATYSTQAFRDAVAAALRQAGG